MGPASSKGGVGRIRNWSREAGRHHPKEAKAGDDQRASETLQDAIDGFLDSKRKRSLGESASPNTADNCRAR